MQHHHDRPFVLLGINTDPEDREVTRARTAALDMTWQSWWDGTDGPIVREWQVPHFPCIYVIDAQGVVRHAELNPRELDHAVAALLNEM